MVIAVSVVVGVLVTRLLIAPLDVAPRIAAWVAMLLVASAMLSGVALRRRAG